MSDNPTQPANKKGTKQNFKIQESQKTDLPESFITIGPATESSPPKSLQVHLLGEEIEIEVNGKETILESLINKDYNPPYSCMEGNCMSCLATITAGAIYQQESGILSESDIANNEILTCQAHPLTSIVKINYND